MDGPAVSFVLLRPLVGFCPDGFGRPQALAQEKRRPLTSLSMRPAVFHWLRCNCETPDRVKPERITAPMALRPDHSDAMAALRETYDFCIRCFRQYGLENVRK